MNELDVIENNLIKIHADLGSIITQMDQIITEESLFKFLQSQLCSVHVQLKNLIDILSEWSGDHGEA